MLLYRQRVYFSGKPPRPQGEYLWRVVSFFRRTSTQGIILEPVVDDERVGRLTHHFVECSDHHSLKSKVADDLSSGVAVTYLVVEV